MTLTKTLLLLPGLALLLVACSDNTPDAKKRPEAEPLPVELSTVNREALGRSITRTGTLEAEREVKLITEEEGRIAQLPVHEGDQVSKGDLLVKLDDTQLRAELKKASAQRQQARLDLQRLERLQARKLISEEELARARTALAVAQAEEQLLRIRLGNTRLTAPFDGVISRRLAEPGDSVAQFTHLLTLTGTDTLLAKIDVSELHLPGISIGDEAGIKVDALGQQRFLGTILRIHPTVDPLTRQGVVEIRLKEPPAGAKPGQLCRVTLELAARPRLLVPFSSLRRDTQGEYVFRLDAERRAMRTAVASGEHLGDKVEILDGLSEGDRVVSNGFLGLSSGMPVRTVDTTNSPGQP